MKVVDIANEIHRELGEPSDLSLAAISYWVRSNIGALNNHINKKYAINSTTYEILDVGHDGDGDAPIGLEEAAILKKMYVVYDYEKKLRSVLGAASQDAVIQISDLGTSIRKVNKNEVGKTFAQVKKQEIEELNRMIAHYKISSSIPRQVAGDDTEEGFYGDSQISKRTGY
tara:strand:- start:224 stop:736 length:513 start_codon:yes stop_codon:yes gene_type:complete